MPSELVLSVGVLVALFVGYNIGGSTTGPAFGPAVGAGVIGERVAAALMSVCFVAGALTVGPEVVATLSEDLLHDQSVFTLRSSAAVLLVIGGALFLGNYAGVPASTSMTAVGAITALGLATGELETEVLGEIVAWWAVAPIAGFWVAAVVGRYWYPRIERLLGLEDADRDRPLVTIARTGVVPRLRFGPTADRRERLGALSLVGIGCLMGYATGSSNIANAIAPLHATGEVGLGTLILLGSTAVAVGAFTIARRTLETVGDGITSLPLPAAIVVAVVSSVLVVGLARIGIPASFVVVATMSIVGLGWGRATRTTTPGDRLEEEGTAVAPDGTGQPPAERGSGAEQGPDAAALFDPSTTARVILMQNAVPIVATVGAFVLFKFAPVFAF